MRRSQVTFGQLSGQVTALDGSTIGAVVTGPSGSLNLTMNLSLESAAGTLTGQLSGRVGSNEPRPSALRHGRRRPPPAARAATEPGSGAGGPPRAMGPLIRAAPADRRARGERARRPRRGLVPRRGQVARRSPGGSRRRPVVVANGAEGEPASRKDAILLLHAPHLVLDGLALAAGDAAAPSRRSRTSRRRASRPCASRSGRAPCPRSDPLAIELAESPDTFIAGQESAVVNALGGRREAVPSFVGLDLHPRARRRGPPHAGAERRDARPRGPRCPLRRGWFRGVGHAGDPRHHAADGQPPGRPAVVEAALGSSAAAGRRVSGRTSSHAARAFLLGGYGGAWVSPRSSSRAPRVREGRPARPARHSVAGVIVPSAA